MNLIRRIKMKIDIFYSIFDKDDKIIWTYAVKEYAESMKRFLNSKYCNKILYKGYGRRTVNKPVRIMQTTGE